MTEFKVAQTNLQLFKQMNDCGYNHSEVRLIVDCYDLVIQVVGHHLRATGKTLNAHLVGTASLLVLAKRPVETVGAGLVHAVFTDGDFGFENSILEMKDKLGEGVFAQTEAYGALRFNYTRQQSNLFLSDIHKYNYLQKEALIIRIANELEDYIDEGLRFYPDEGKKGANWRRQHILEVFPVLKEMANKVGVHVWEEFFERIEIDTQFTASSNISIYSNMGYNSGKMFSIRQRSMIVNPVFLFFRFFLKLRNIIIKVLRVLKSRVKGL